MKQKLWKKRGKQFCALCLGMVFSVTGTIQGADPSRQTAFAAEKNTGTDKPSLQKELVLRVGECDTLEVKNLKGQKIRWTVASGKKVVHLSVVKKKAEISGLKAGRAKILAKVGKKKLYCKVKVRKVNYGVREEEESESTSDPVSKLPMSENSVNLMQQISSKKVSAKQPSLKFSYATADFSVKMLKKLMKQDKTGKVLISPDSILTALAMLEQGASNATLKEMQELRGKGISQNSYHAYLSTLNKSLTASKGVTYRVADSIWKRNDSFYQLSPSFLQKNKSFYDAEIYEAPFDDSTVSDVNAWCSNHTNGMIPKIIDQFPKSQDAKTAFLLLNAVLFEGAWNEPYEDGQVKKEKFTTESGKKQTVSMMKEETNAYIKINGGTGFIKEYKNSRFAFVGMLPKTGQSVDDFIKELTGKDFVIACKSQRYQRTLTKLPEFSYDYSVSLKQTLQSMGMKQAFSESQADFSHMVGELNPSVHLFVGDVLHKTHIEVDKNGTKAAAATAVMMNETTSIRPVQEPKKVYLDRPFAYAVIDRKTGIPLFLGAVKNI